MVTHKGLRVCGLVTHKGLKVTWAGHTQRVKRVVDWSHTMGFKKVIGRKEFLSQSHPHVAEVTCPFELVTLGVHVTGVTAGNG